MKHDYKQTHEKTNTFTVYGKDPEVIDELKCVEFKLEANA